MQQAQHSSEGSSVPTHAPRRSSPSLLAVVLLVVIAAVAAGIYFMSRADEDTSTTTEIGPRENSFALTDDEAIAKFNELQGLALRAARERDPTLLRHVFTTGGPIATRASRSINELLRKGVLDKSVVTTLSVKVLDHAPEQIKLLQVSHLYPCFLAESGKNVTRGPSAIRQEIVWTLRLEGSRWLINDAVLRNDREINGSPDDC